ncbi:type II toxin-antitoxin system VapC family toxin [Candidatus Curtissbacteria bacterium]|nr:type II toxin-antitoxin system VapC family toxin [Candidatus Curtissbacteria bacterium]
MTNRLVIADSSALVSLSSITDRNHRLAISLSNQLTGTNRQLVIPGDVFAETINTLGKKVSHNMAFGTASEILNSDSSIITEANPTIRQNALDKFQNQTESVSYTNCIVMAFADEYETREIFGFDNVFRKNGYIRLGIDKNKTKSPN